MRVAAVAVLASLALVACADEPPPSRRLSAGRLGEVEIDVPPAAPRGLVFLFSDSEGAGEDLAEEAHGLVAHGAAVVRVDLPQYLAGLAASSDGCHYVVAELEALSQRLQRELGFERYRSPILAGVGAGGTLAEAALAQAPAATLGAAVAADPAPSLATRVPLCAGAVSRAAPGGGFAYDLPASLPAPLISVPREGLRTAVEALLAAEGTLAGLPLVELPAAKPASLLAVIWSGDGGWRDLDKTIGGLLAARGVNVVGVDSLRYFWHARTPEQVAADLAAILAGYRARWQVSHVLLVGYSFGAGVLPAAYNRLPEAERGAVVQLSLLGLEPTAEFEFHVAGWLGKAGTGARPVLPELAKIDLSLLQCFYGEEEPATLCRAPELADAELVRTRGGHHFDGDYVSLAEKILSGAQRRLALHQPPRRATSPPRR